MSKDNYLTYDNLYIAILVIFIILYLYSRVIEHCDLEGFWTASEDFCEESGVRGMMLYVGPGFYYKNSYLIINGDDGLIANNPITISLGSTFTVSPFRSYCKNHSIYVDWLDDEQDFMPSYMTMQYYPTTGKLVLTDGDTIYAILYKNHNTTEYAYT